VTAFEATPERREVRLKLDARQARAGIIRELAAVVRDFPGEAPVIVDLETSEGPRTLQFGSDYRVKPEPDFFAEVKALLGEARFAPVFHRPLFRHMGYVTIRTFETFEADALPVLMLPRDFVSAIYGPAALALVPGDDVAAHMKDALRRPEPYWQAVLQTRAHLARHHSFARRFEEIAALVKDRGRGGR